MTSRPSALFGLYGAGGFAREVMPWLAESVSAWQAGQAGRSAQTRYVQTEPTLEQLGGIAVIAEADFLAATQAERYFNIAIANSLARERLAQRALAQGARPLSLAARDSVVYADAQIGEGAILCAYTVVSSLARIGRYFHANFHCYVAHDCVIGDFVTLGPRATCNGNVHIGDHAYIGAGALIRQGTPERPLRIGAGAVVGMGAVVTKDVPPHVTVVGNPARILPPRPPSAPTLNV